MFREAKIQDSGTEPFNHPSSTMEVEMDEPTTFESEQLQPTQSVISAIQDATVCSHCQKLAIDDRKHQLYDMALENDRMVCASPEEIHVSFRRQDTYPDLPLLKDSAENGCSICRLLRTSIRERYSASFARIISQLQGHELDGSNAAVSIEELKGRRLTLHRFSYQRDHALVKSESAFDGFSYLQGLIEVEHGKLSDVMYEPSSWPLNFSLANQGVGSVRSYLGVTRRRLEPHILSKYNAEMMRSWIETCEVDHPDCTVKVPSFLPTRLLYIGTDDIEDLRLIITATDPMLCAPTISQIQYAALSYCWGDTSKYPPLETRPSTLQAHLQSLQSSNMPATIADAITVTRSLGLQYLWIDALCIIQGDPEDWQTESAKMTQVYGHAYVTIAAALGDSSHSGFLAPTSSRQIEQASLPCRALARYGVSEKIYLRPTTYLYDWSSFEADIQTSTWNQRAWTFQEDIISPRVLYFGKQLYYQCQTSACVESVPHPVDIPEDEQRSRIYKASDSHSKSGKSIYSFWRNAVRTYSGRAISFEEDRLPAISGIAHYVASITEDVYLAGLWRNDLLIGLLWRASAPIGRAEKYLGPSWSWVPAGSSELWWLTYADNADEVSEECDIIDTQVSIEGADPMGRVSAGKVTLRGKLQWLDDGMRRELGRFFFWDEEDGDNSHKEVAAFLIVRILAGLASRNATDMVLDGLLLERVEGEKRDACWRRVGVFEIVERPGVLTGLTDCDFETVTVI